MNLDNILNKKATHKALLFLFLIVIANIKVIVLSVYPRVRSEGDVAESNFRSSRCPKADINVLIIRNGKVEITHCRVGVVANLSGY